MRGGPSRGGKALRGPGVCDRPWMVRSQRCVEQTLAGTAAPPGGDGGEEHLLAAPGQVSGGRHLVGTRCRYTGGSQSAGTAEPDSPPNERGGLAGMVAGTAHYSYEFLSGWHRAAGNPRDKAGRGGVCPGYSIRTRAVHAALAASMA
uniref:Uncharacterized protein n=1 Tax=Knipowitschia caucasica TaxID=637954 RepID=A0AAV2LFV8_KNICA